MVSVHNSSPEETYKTRFSFDVYNVTLTCVENASPSLCYIHLGSCIDETVSAGTATATTSNATAASTAYTSSASRFSSFSSQQAIVDATLSSELSVSSTNFSIFLEPSSSSFDSPSLL